MHHRTGRMTAMTTEYVTTLKKTMMGKIIERADQMTLTQKELATVLETTQPRVSNLFSMQTEKFSLDALFRYAYTLAIDTTVTLKV